MRSQNQFFSLSCCSCTLPSITDQYHQEVVSTYLLMYFILFLLELLLPLHNAPLVGPSPHCLPLKAICTKSYMNVYSCAFIQDFSFCWAHLGHHHFVALKRIICGLLHNFPHIHSSSAFSKLLFQLQSLFESTHVLFFHFLSSSQGLVSHVNLSVHLVDFLQTQQRDIHMVFKQSFAGNFS